MRAMQVPSYIIHRRAFRETSLIVDAIVQGYGRVSMVLRGAQSSKRVAKKSSTSATAQMFQPVLLSFSGMSDLKTAIGIEANGVGLQLQEKFLYCGFYVNELLCRIWPQNVASDDVYPRYHQLLNALSALQNASAANDETEHSQHQHQHQSKSQVVLEQLLRQFEFELLHMLGFGVDWHYCFDTQQAINADEHYLFSPEQGFSVTALTVNLRGANHSHSSPAKAAVFAGKDILAIANGQPLQGQSLIAAKCLSRLALAPHLGDKPLKSRELFKLI